MRKASKKTIAASLKAYADWRAKLDARLAKLPRPARKYLREWADDVRTRIEAGEVGPCMQALIDSVNRDTKAWEEGYFSGVAKNGARIVTSHA